MQHLSCAASTEEDASFYYSQHDNNDRSKHDHLNNNKLKVFGEGGELGDKGIHSPVSLSNRGAVTTSAPLRWWTAIRFETN